MPKDVPENAPPPGVLRARKRLRVLKDGRFSARTIAAKPLSREEKRLSGSIKKQSAVMPTRDQCRGGHRPCPLVRCAYNLYLDVNPKTGGLKLNFPAIEPEDMKESCSLDIADQGEHSLEEIAAVFGITRERVRQIQDKALEDPGLAHLADHDE